jgi:hypothetical protein
MPYQKHFRADLKPPSRVTEPRWEVYIICCGECNPVPDFQPRKDDSYFYGEPVDVDLKMMVSYCALYLPL